MIIKLEEKLTDLLLEQPESGMGYQIVDVETRNQWLKKEAIVLNAEILIYLDDIESFQILKKIKVFEEIKKFASVATDIVDLKVKPELTSRGTYILKEPITKYSAIESQTEFTKPNEKFKRFTGFINDRRINPDRSLKLGTYATTEEDAKNVRIRIDAIKRYALPSDNTAKYVFTIESLPQTEIQKGIVQPKFGRPGGGIEVIFTKGTTPNTVKFPPEEVPEKI
jgi:hypothetical protein